MVGEFEIVIRLILGAVVGSLIGLERQRHGRPAGVRTHILVCTASVVIMIVSMEYYRLSTLNPAFARVDPARIAAGAITGVGFLGAGVIIKGGQSIIGLTTAACLWMVSSLGLAIGSGLYLLALAGFIVTFLSLNMLRGIEAATSTLYYKHLNITSGKGVRIEAFTPIIKDAGFTISSTDYEFDRGREESRFSITISYRDNSSVERLLTALTGNSEVRGFSLKG